MLEKSIKLNIKSTNGEFVENWVSDNENVEMYSSVVEQGIPYLTFKSSENYYNF